MGILDALAAGAFKTDAEGRILFFPWARYGRGYVIPTAEEREELRKRLKVWLIVGPTSLFIVSNVVSYAAAFLLFFAWLALYGCWTARYCNRLTPSGEKYGEATGGVENNLAMLWVFELSAVTFLVSGILFPLQRGRLIVLDCVFILFTGTLTVIFTTKIVRATRQQNWPGGR